MFSANPRATPTARLIRALHYDEAQEIATSGAKVLHPRCLLPARQYQIPLYVYATQTPDLEGTLITGESGAGSAQVKAVCNRKGITLISLDSPGMWHQVGFMADAFAVFKEHGMSVDLVSTSETNVTVSLDPAANTLDGELLGKLQARPVEAVRRAGHRALRLACRWSAATSAPSCTSSATRSRCSKSRRCTWSARRPTISTSRSSWTRTRATGWSSSCTNC